MTYSAALSACADAVARLVNSVHLTVAFLQLAWKDKLQRPIKEGHLVSTTEDKMQARHKAMPPQLVKHSRALLGVPGGLQHVSSSGKWRCAQDRQFCCCVRVALDQVCPGPYTCLAPSASMTYARRNGVPTRRLGVNLPLPPGAFVGRSCRSAAEEPDRSSAASSL